MIHSYETTCPMCGFVAPSYGWRDWHVIGGADCQTIANLRAERDERQRRIEAAVFNLGQALAGTPGFTVEFARDHLLRATSQQETTDA